MKELQIKLRAEDYDGILIEKDLNAEDRRLNLLIHQYENLNRQLLINIENDERARMQLDFKTRAMATLSQNRVRIQESEQKYVNRERAETLSFARHAQAASATKMTSDCCACQVCMKDCHCDVLDYKYKHLDHHLKESVYQQTSQDMESIQQRACDVQSAQGSEHQAMCEDVRSAISHLKVKEQSAKKLSSPLKQST